MKKVVEVITDTLKNKSLYVFLAVTLLFFGIYIIQNFTVDTYGYSVEIAPAIHLVNLGRLISGAFFVVLSGITLEARYMISFILAILATVFSMYKLNEILKRDIKNEKMTILISILTIINFSILELYMFVEKGIMMLSVLFVIMAVGNIEKALSGNKKAIILILIEMFAANCCYQGTVGLFVAIGSIYIVKNSKKISEFIKNNIIVGLLYAIPAFLNLLIVKFIFYSNRLENPLSLGEKISKIMENLANIMKETFGILPDYVFVGFAIIVILLFIIKIIQSKEKISKKVLNFFFLIYVIAAVVVAAVAPQIVSAQVYIVPRTIYCLGALVAIILMLMYQRVKTEKIVDISIILCGIIFLAILYANFTDIILDHYYTNKLDMDRAEKIVAMMENYEKETGKTITKVAFYPNSDKAQYEDTRFLGDANARAFYTEWGTRGILELILNRPLGSVEKNEEIDTFFKNQDWQDYEFNEQQVIIKDDTLHLCTK